MPTYMRVGLALISVGFLLAGFTEVSMWVAGLIAATGAWIIGWTAVWRWLDRRFGRPTP